MIMKYSKVTGRALLLSGLVVNVLAGSLCKDSKAEFMAAKYRAEFKLNSVTIRNEFPFSLDFFGITYFGTSGNLIDREILLYGAYEKPLLFFMRDNFGLSGCRNFVDVGSNRGQHSFFMSKYAQTIYAFEPYDPAWRDMTRMIQLNKLSQIHLWKIGLGEINSEADFFKPPQNNLGTGSFIRNFSKENTPFKKLPIVRGDDFFKANNIKDFCIIKIDIEGSEKSAMEGLQQTLKKERPIVVMEYNLVGRNFFGKFESFEKIVPDGYLFKYFSTETYDYDTYTGRYQLVDFTESVFDNVNDDRYHLNLVLIPKELSHAVKLTND